MGTIEERRTGKGKIVFDASVRRRGQRPSYKTFARLTDARAWIQDMESGIRAGRTGCYGEAEKHTLAEAIDRYIEEESERGKRSFPDQKRALLWFKDALGFKLLSDITPAAIIELKSKWLKGSNRHGQKRKPQSWNRHLSALSGVFQSCVLEWQWLDFNLIRRVRREREAPGRVRFLSDEERDRLLKACREARSANLYPLVILSLSTGMRRGEIKWLTWEQVDLAAGVIVLNRTKNGERRRVPVRGLSLTLLRDHAKVRRIDTNYVFPGERTKQSKQPFELEIYWKEALTAAKIEDFRFHDLRHSCASYLAMNGASLLEIAEVLGHKTLQMVKRYSHLAESHTASVVEKMNKKIFG